MKIKESYLHFLFDNRVLGSSFTTVNNMPVSIIDFGILNSNAGPDFLEAKINYDQKIWAGHIEFHVNASDWRKHNHQSDPNYNNVILHIVYNYDEDIYVNKFKIPTVEIKSQIAEDNYNQYLSLHKSKYKIACLSSIGSISPKTVENQIKIAFESRINRKVVESVHVISEFKGDHFKLYLNLLAKQFGGKVNAHSFVRLVSLLDYKIIGTLNYSLFKIESLIFGLAGFLNEKPIDDYQTKLFIEYNYLKRLHNLQSMNVKEWKFSRMYYNGFPTYRLAQFSALLVYPNFINADFKYEKVSISDYWIRHYNFGKKTNSIKNKSLSSAFVNLIITNVDLVYYSTISALKDEIHHQDNIIAILENIKAESNSIITEWKKLGIKINNAKESQGLIEQMNSFCSKKKCLNCLIGKDILI